MDGLDDTTEFGQRRRRVVIGVGGGIAAYKACALIRAFTESGHQVRVIPTESALEFVGRATFEALSGNPVHTGVFTDVPQVPHVRLGQEADLVVVAPATADLMARAVQGRADDLLTATLLTARCPVMFAPAMHTEMWEHPATVDNVETLRRRGVVVVEPASGRLTGQDTGAGRLPEPEEIFGLATLLLERADALPRDLTGRKLVISAGGTREPLDPVRFLGNRSSGKQGLAIAHAAARRGARVVLVAANVDLPTPPGVTVVPVETTLELKDAVETAAREADAVIMAAAPADFRPASVSASKIKKGTDPDAGLRLELVENPDIVKGLVASRDGSRRPVIVSFAAETGDASGSVMDHARAKFAKKGSDLQVVNEVGRDLAFGRDDNTVHLLRRDVPEVVTVGPAGKDVIAGAVLDVVEDLLG